jgi:hypothetical protein
MLRSWELFCHFWGIVARGNWRFWGVRYANREIALGNFPCRFAKYPQRAVPQSMAGKGDTNRKKHGGNNYVQHKNIDDKMAVGFKQPPIRETHKYNHVLAVYG